MGFAILTYTLIANALSYLCFFFGWVLNIHNLSAQDAVSVEFHAQAISGFYQGYRAVKKMYDTIKRQPVEFYHVSQTYDSHGNPAQIIVSRYPDIAAKKKS
ncbi:hypothetical protein JL49_18620 [Pseudoalteromonas luteoviolacea]|nr:hypothetical protein JL49_18620 [Pseudoalteromonas luteoviolacea]